jgi:hypothetical protein
MPICPSRLATARMNELKIEQDAVDPPLPPPTWRGAAAIHLARQMNERCIDLFCDLAVAKPAESDWPFLSSNRDLWCRLDLDARRRLTTFPFVIVDLCFDDESWWRARAAGTMVLDTATETSNALPASRYECLALEALMFAWQVAREDRRVAHLVFGMAFPVAECIAALSMRQIRTIAIESARVLRARWDGKPRFWRELLIAAAEANDIAMVELKHHAARRFLGEVL